MSDDPRKVKMQYHMSDVIMFRPKSLIVSSFHSERAASYMAENTISVKKVGVCSTYGAFRDKLTSAHYPSTWNFLENWYIGGSCAQKPNLAILHPTKR